MESIEMALREAFFPALFVGKEAKHGLRQTLGYITKPGGLGIQDPRRTAAR